MTEWYDDSEPPPPFAKFLDEDIIVPWSQLSKGQRVRWHTPQFQWRGTIQLVKGRSMVVRFDHGKVVTIPDAKWYFVQGRLGNIQEHLIPINSQAPEGASSEAVEVELESGDWLTPAQASYITGEDAKNIRRKIRNGTYTSKRVGGRWVVARESL